MDYSEELHYRKNRRRFRVIASVFLFLITILTGGGVYLFFYTDAFYFTHIEIIGLKSLKSENVLTKDKISFFETIDLKNPLIKTSTISRDYISKKLVITIEEREPYAIWCHSLREALVISNAEVATSPPTNSFAIGGGASTTSSTAS